MFFTTTTIIANLICFQGAQLQSFREIVNVCVGFAIMCVGVFLLWSPNQSDLLRSIRLEDEESQFGREKVRGPSFDEFCSDLQNTFSGSRQIKINCHRLEEKKFLLLFVYHPPCQIVQHSITFYKEPVEQ